MTTASQSETRAALGESARRWIAEVYGEDRRRRALAEGGFDREAWCEMAALGWFGMAVPEELGGLGLGVGELAALAQAIGAGNLPEPVMAVAGVAAPILALVAGRDAESAERLARLVAGSETVVLAHGEAAAGFDRTHVQTAAMRDGEGWRLKGDKSAVEGGAAADTFLVSARTSEGIALFLLGRDAPGLSLTTFRALDGRMLADLQLKSVRVGAPLPLPGTAATSIDDALDRGALLAMADAVGAMSVLFEDTLAHLRSRQQFGQPLGRFQALQHRAVDMSVALEEARAVVAAAADVGDGDPDERRRAVATAKVVGVRSARRIGREAVQLHGGIGITEDLRVSHLFRRLVAAEGLYGDDDYYLDRFRELAPG